MRLLTLVLTLFLVAVGVAQSSIRIASADLESNSVVGGRPLELRVLLLEPAPTSGQIPVTSTRADLCLCRSLAVQAGQSQLMVLVQTREVDQPTPITLSLGVYGNIRDLQFTLQPDPARKPPTVVQLRMPTRLTAGDSSTATIVLDHASTREVTLALEASENLTITLPIRVPAGSRQLEVKFSTRPSRQPGTARLSWRGARTVSGETQLLPAVEVSSLQVSPARPQAGEPCTGKVTLSATAEAPAKVSLAASPNLRVPAEVTVPQGSSSVSFTTTSAPSRSQQRASLVASTPLGQKSLELTLELTSSLFALEASNYYVMAGSKDGWLEVADPLAPGKKWRLKPEGAPRLAEPGPFAHQVLLKTNGTLAEDGLQHSVLLRLQLEGDKDKWRVTEVKILEVDGVARQ